ncbi:universal stress protein [Granulosicoccus sp.]|nr:universal stress protein [Granulosicoccus sp.]MDB4222706.1 universal stress protein [Granulosicoccus sp.]
MSKLLAVIDGSAYSASVCEHAAWIAEYSPTEVDVVHVLGRRDVSSEPSNLSGSIGLGARSSLLSELVELDAQKAKLAQKRGRAILEDAEALLRQRGVTKVNTKLRNGEIVDTVQTLEKDAKLIVIGKRGEAANFDSGHLGSNIERVVRSTPLPVLVASRSFKPIKKVLVAFDGGPSSLKAIEYFAAQKQYNNLECHVLSVGTGTTDQKRQLEGAVATLKSGGYNATGEIVEGHTEMAIAAKVEQSNIDLLLMGAYGHSRIRNLIIGSTTTEMIRSCKVPVLLFR